MDDELFTHLNKFVKEAVGMFLVLDSKIVALVNCLPAEKQKEWIQRHNQYCANKGINPVDGLKNERTTKSS